MSAVCPCCYAIRSRLFGQVGDQLFRTTSRTFQLRECASCGVVFLTPAPDDRALASFYPLGYWWQTGRPSERHSAHDRLLDAYRRLMTKSYARRIRRLMANSSTVPARLLDVGCGDGLLLATCEGLPLARLGADVSFAAVHAALERGGQGTIQSDLKALPFRGESFGIVTLLHVLEHIAEPDRCLTEMRRLLAPGGWVLVQVPNATSWQRRLLGRRWAGFDVPRHLINYTERSLLAVLQRNGFRIARISHLSLRDNPAMIIMSLFPGLYPPGRRLDWKQQKGMEVWWNGLLDFAYFALVWLAAPLACAESLAGRGGTIVVEAQKVN